MSFIVLLKTLLKLTFLFLKCTLPPKVKRSAFLPLSVAQLTGASTRTPKGCQSYTLSKHMPTLWVRSLVRVHSREDRCFSFMSLSQINKNTSSSEDLTNIKILKKCFPLAWFRADHSTLIALTLLGHRYGWISYKPFRYRYTACKSKCILGGWGSSLQREPRSRAGFPFLTHLLPLLD